MKSVKSPFELTTPLEDPRKLLEGSSVPPGAHEDQFRRVKFDTSKSRNDPERVFFTTTSMTEGVRTTPQPPWYYGYQNKLKPQDSDPVMSSSRYGFRGAKEIAQFMQSPKAPPEKTATEHTPKFLNTNHIDDEWVPPMQSKPHTNGFALTMPGMWPENAAYPTGTLPNNEIPTSPVYKRETTVGNYNIRPYTSPDTMVRTLGHPVDKSTKILRKSAKLESRGQLESLQRAETVNFRHTWNQKLEKTANATLRASMKHETPPYLAHTLSDPSDRLRYSDSTAIITNSTSAEELVFKQYMEKCQEVKPYEMKWNTVIANFRILKSRLQRDQNVKDAIDFISKKLKSEANRHGQKDALMRKPFIMAMQKTPYFEHLPMKQISLLFSMFDTKKKSIICYADLICAFMIFDSPRQYTDNALDLILELWRICQQFGDDNPPMEYAQKVLTTCCGSREEEKLINKIFKEKFRPVLYRLSVRCEEDKDKNSRPTTSRSVMFADRDDMSSNPSTSRSMNKTGQSANDKKEYKGSTIKPAFNIYDRYFDESMFVTVLEQCPEMMDAFQTQLKERYVQCYGDEKDTEECVPQMEEKDFSWILGGKGGKK